MSNLIGNLLTNADALNVHSLGVETAGRNIAHANDPAYARQRINLREGGNFKSGTRTQTFGIEALGVEHIRNVILDKQIMNENMKRASLETQADLLRQLETDINDIIDRPNTVESLNGNKSENLAAGGISTAIDDFLNAFSELASSTGSETLKEVVFQRAEILIDQFQAADKRLSKIDSFIALDVQSDVDQANTLIDKIADLNAQIARLETNQGVLAPDLRDERQEAIEELAKFIDFETETSGINPVMIDVKIRNAQVGTTAGDSFTKVVTGGSVNGELFYQQFEAAAVAGATPTTVDKIIFRKLGTESTENKEIFLKGGSIQGSLQIKKDNLLRLRSDFDTLAKQVVSSVNTAYQGDPAVATNKIFDADKITAAEITFDASLLTTETIDGQEVTFLDVDKLKTSNNTGGGNELALAIGELTGTKVIGVDTTVAQSGQTFGEFIAQFSARIGAEVEDTSSELDNQVTIDDFLRQQRESHSGVSIDEEMTDLLRFQRTFQGTSRVINVLDTLLEQVVSGLVR